MKVKLMKSIMLSVGLFFSGITLSDFNLNVVIKGVNTVKQDADAFTAAFNKAKIELANAQIKLKDNSIPAKDQALVAVNALVDSIEPLYLFLKTIETLDTAMINAEIPYVSGKINDTVKPQIDKIMKVATQIKGATNALNALIPKK